MYQTLNTPDQVFGVQGGAGTGKTTALEPIREVAVEHGYATLGLAATSGAVKALRNSGLEADCFYGTRWRCRLYTDPLPFQLN